MASLGNVIEMLGGGVNAKTIADLNAVSQMGFNVSTITDHGDRKRAGLMWAQLTNFVNNKTRIRNGFRDMAIDVFGSYIDHLTDS